MLRMHASSVGVASTGTAISGLSGGSLATGGGGMALGSIVLGGITIGPDLMIGGLVFAGQVEQALYRKLRQFDQVAPLRLAGVGSVYQKLYKIRHLV